MRETGSPLYQLFLLFLSIYVLTVLAIEPFIVDPEMTRVLQYIDFSICLVFLGDFIVNFRAAPRKLEYMKWGWIDLVSSIPMVDLLRWGRVARIVRILRFFRTIKSIKALFKAVEDNRIQAVTLVVLLITFLSYTVSASLILEFERNAGSAIQTANDALWWSLLNILNAKVSLDSAVTPEGQILTIFLNKIGLLLFAYFNAVVIAWIIRKDRENT